MKIGLKLKIFLGIVGGIGVILGIKNMGTPVEEVVPEVEVTAKEAETIIFKEWEPDEKRSILATVESDKSIEILSELSGSIDAVFVEIGQTVEKGALIATFKKESDETQIRFENAVIDLQQAQVSANASVSSVEILLESAIKSAKQTQITEKQNQDQALSDLLNTARNTETSLSNTLNFIDRVIGASPKFKYEVYPGRYEVGAKDKRRKQAVYSAIEKLQRDFGNLEDIQITWATEAEILDYTKQRFEIAKELQKVITDFDSLVRSSIVSARFTESDRATMQTQTEGLAQGLDQELLFLEGKKEGIQTLKEKIQLTNLAAENNIETQKANLEISKANLNSQIQSAQSRYSLAKRAQKDLEIRAPFTGKITGKWVNASEQVNPNQKLFTFEGTSNNKKIVTFLSLEEWEIFKTLKKITGTLPDKTHYATEKKFISSTIDPLTQKIKVEVEINAPNLLVGSFTTIELPLKSETKILIPLSAISFEVDGAEVLLIQPEDQSLSRKKVQYGKIVSENIEILDGIQGGDEIIRYYDRVSIGDIIKK